MDAIKLNKELEKLLKLRFKLKNLGYDHPDYDIQEEVLENNEDAFVEEYGDFFEDVLQAVHKEFCPNTDVLLPTAYLPRENYEKIIDEELGIEEFEIGENDGVWVTLKDFPKLDAKLVLLPTPTRLEILSMGGSQEVWRLK